MEHAAVRTRVGRYLTLSLGQDVLALAIRSVREILGDQEITRIPHAPPNLSGVVNVRGRAIPVLDLRRLFGLKPCARTHDTRIVIVERKRDGRVLLVGALADAVRDVLEIEPEAIAPPPRTGSDILEGIARVGDRFLMLLDVDKVFSGDILAALPEEDSGLASGGNAEASGREDSLPQAE